MAKKPAMVVVEELEVAWHSPDLLLVYDGPETIYTPFGTPQQSKRCIYLPVDLCRVVDREKGMVEMPMSIAIEKGLA